MITQKMATELNLVAYDLEFFIKNARPYDLTFYNDNIEPLTDGQKKRLQEHLVHQFHEIWAPSWILPLADKIRKTIGIKPLRYN